MKQSTKDKLLKTPVIGQIVGIALLPREIGKVRKLQEEAAETRRAADALRQGAEEQRQAAEAYRQTTEERWQATEARWQATEERWQATEERWQATTQTFDSMGQQTRDIQAQLAEAKEELQFSKGFGELLRDGTALSRLRTELSIHPAVWGPADRLHIDPEASMDACLFNTNSGSITVGAYTFAGPGVSLIAGNHDIKLAGFPRRDLQQEAGCDIGIGRGVWLCANCTILGPCRIGDNAVIAAGAVVIPGTEVEAGCLYAGVPARKIRKIDVADGEAQFPEEAFGRFGGCLYTRGWHTAEAITDEGGQHTGHWMIREEAEIVCPAGERTLRYRSPMGPAEDRSMTVTAGDRTEEIRCGETGEIRIPAEAFRGEKTGKITLRISLLFDPGNGDPRRLGLFIW